MLFRSQRTNHPPLESILPSNTPFVSTPGPAGFPNFEDTARIHDAEPTLQDLVLGYDEVILPAEDFRLIPKHRSLSEFADNARPLPSACSRQVLYPAVPQFDMHGEHHP